VRSGSIALAYFKRTVTRAKFSGADALAVTRNTPTTLQRPQKALARPCGGRLRLLGWGRPLRIVGTSRTPWEAARDASLCIVVNKSTSQLVFVSGKESLALGTPGLSRKESSMADERCRLGWPRRSGRRGGPTDGVDTHSPTSPDPKNHRNAQSIEVSVCRKS